MEGWLDEKIQQLLDRFVHNEYAINTGCYHMLFSLVT